MQADGLGLSCEDGKTQCDSEWLWVERSLVCEINDGEGGGAVDNEEQFGEDPAGVQKLKILEKFPEHHVQSNSQNNRKQKSRIEKFECENFPHGGRTHKT